MSYSYISNNCVHGKIECPICKVIKMSLAHVFSSNNNYIILDLVSDEKMTSSSEVIDLVSEEKKTSSSEIIDLVSEEKTISSSEVIDLVSEEDDNASIDSYATLLDDSMNEMPNNIQASSSSDATIARSTQIRL